MPPTWRRNGDFYERFTNQQTFIVTFGVILAMFLCTVVLSVFSLLSTGNNFDSFYKGPFEVTNSSADLRGSIQTVAKYIGYSMMEEDETKTAEYIRAAQDEIQSLRDDRYR